MNAEGCVKRIVMGLRDQHGQKCTYAFCSLRAHTAPLKPCCDQQHLIAPPPGPSESQYAAVAVAVVQRVLDDSSIPIHIGIQPLTFILQARASPIPLSHYGTCATCGVAHPHTLLSLDWL